MDASYLNTWPLLCQKCVLRKNYSRAMGFVPGRVGFSINRGILSDMVGVDNFCLLSYGSTASGRFAFGAYPSMRGSMLWCQQAGKAVWSVPQAETEGVVAVLSSPQILAMFAMGNTEGWEKAFFNCCRLPYKSQQFTREGSQFLMEIQHIYRPLTKWLPPPGQLTAYAYDTFF